MASRKLDNDDHLNSTEYRYLDGRVEKLESLPASVEYIKVELKNIGYSVGTHIDKSLPGAVAFSLAPIVQKMDNVETSVNSMKMEMDNIKITVNSMKMEMDIRKQIRAEDKAKAEEDDLKREAARTRFWTRFAIFVPLIVAVIGLLSATLVSQQKQTQSPSQPIERKTP